MFKHIGKYLLAGLIFFTSSFPAYAVLPNIFATQPSGNVAASLLDQNYTFLENQGVQGLTTSGSSNAYVATPADAWTVGYSSYVARALTVIPNFTNSAASTVNVSGLGTASIYKNIAGTATALSSGDIKQGIPAILICDGTGFLLANPSGSSGGVTSVTNSDGSLTVSPTTGAVVASCTTATSSQLGCVKPDGTIITNTAGAITVAKGSSSGYGVVEVDNTTITASSGVISAVTGLPAAVTGSLAGVTSKVFTVDFTTYAAYSLMIAEAYDSGGGGVVVDVSTDGGSTYVTAVRLNKKMITTVTNLTTSEGTLTNSATTPFSMSGMLIQTSTGGRSALKGTSGEPSSAAYVLNVDYPTAAAINRVRITDGASINFTAGNVILQPISKR